MTDPVRAMRRVLALAVRVHFRPDGADEFGRAVVACREVGRLLAMADRCYALPLLASACRRSGIRPEGDGVAEVLDAAYYLCAARRAGLSRLLDRVADVLQGADVPFLVLKGGALELLAPRAPAARITADLDVLVPGGEMARCEALLAASGFRPRYPGHEQEFRRHSHHAVPYEPVAESENGALWSAAVEIHESLGSRIGSAALSSFWERSRLVRRAGRDFRCPAPEELVLYTCVHYGLLHPYNTTLRRVWDLAILSNLEAWSLPGDGHGAVDWSDVEERARAWGARRVLAAARAELAWLEDCGGAASVIRGPDEWPLFEEAYRGLAAFRLQQAATEGIGRRCESAWRFLFPGPHETAPMRGEETHWRYLARRALRWQRSGPAATHLRWVPGRARLPAPEVKQPIGREPEQTDR